MRVSGNAAGNCGEGALKEENKGKGDFFPIIFGEMLVPSPKNT